MSGIAFSVHLRTRVPTAEAQSSRYKHRAQGPDGLIGDPALPRHSWMIPGHQVQDRGQRSFPRSGKLETAPTRVINLSPHRPIFMHTPCEKPINRKCSQSSLPCLKLRRCLPTSLLFMITTPKFLLLPKFFFP